MEEFPLQKHLEKFYRDLRTQRKDSRAAFELLQEIILDQTEVTFYLNTTLSNGQFKRINHEECRDNLRLDNKTVFYVLLGFAPDIELFTLITKLFGNEKNNNDAVYHMYLYLLTAGATIEQAGAVLSSCSQKQETPFHSTFQQYRQSEKIAIHAAFDMISKAISKRNNPDFANDAHLSPVTLRQIDERGHRFDSRTVFKITLACRQDIKWFREVETLFGRPSVTNRAEYRLMQSLLRKKCSFSQANAVFEACGLQPLY